MGQSSCPLQLRWSGDRGAALGSMYSQHLDPFYKCEYQRLESQVSSSHLSSSKGPDLTLQNDGDGDFFSGLTFTIAQRGSHS